MKLFVPKYPSLLKAFYPRRLSRIEHSEAIYLSFDDGPVPEVTPWVLDILKKFDAKASFFCIGDNVQKHPDIFNRISREGHCIGNHTFHHLNGWKTSNTEYINDIRKAEMIMLENMQEKPGNASSKKLFRPPYGKIRNSQARHVAEEGFKIVMWDVISGDYDRDFSAEQCLSNVIRNTTKGSCIVFHDSLKAFKNLKVILPEILTYYTRIGFEFRSLKDVL